MVLPYTKVKNDGLKYVNGLGLEYVVTAPSGYVTGKVFVIGAGQARDESDLADLVLPLVLDANGDPALFDGHEYGAIVNGARVGANGLDSGVLAPNTRYAVYLIGSSVSVQSTSEELAGGPSPNPLGPLAVPAPLNPYPVAGLISLASNAAPILPKGYDMYRRIGWVTTNATAAPNTLFRPWWQYGADQARWYYLDTAVLVVAAAGAGPTGIPLAVGVGGSSGVPAVPPLATQVLLDVELSGAGTARFYPFGSSSAAGIVRFSAAGATQPGNVVVPAKLNAGVPTVNVAVSAGTAALSVIGYQDIL